MSERIVVGAGPSGLGAALALAERGSRAVRLLDRIPVPGGESGWDDQAVRELARRAAEAGVTFDLGITAITWRDRRLLVSGPGRVETLDADHLFFAGGLRPGTAADERLSGERPAGVIPATVAEHLLHTGAALWREVVILGDGPWTERVAEGVRATGGRVTKVAGPGVVLGRRHVEGLRVGDRTYPCDAIVLAGGPLPNRNVDGALTDRDPGVTFIQPLDIEGVEARAQRGAELARTWLARGEGR